MNYRIVSTIFSVENNNFSMFISCRATVVEDHEIWYKDGELSLEFCEDDQECDNNQPEFDFTCYACDDALYEVTVLCINE
jgi:hypothetical protein